jgi:hypothetical protein
MSCERWRGLEKSYAGADPSDTWGRPPSLEIGRPVGIGRAKSDKSQRSRRGISDGMFAHGEPTQHEKPHVGESRELNRKPARASPGRMGWRRGS